MAKFYTRQGKFEHEDGKVSKYELSVSENDDGKPNLFVLRHNENLNEQQRNELTEGVAKEMSSSKEYNVPPENMNWFEQRSDGHFDKVDFKFLDRDVETRGENLSEYHRRVVPAEHVENRENNAKHEAMMSEWKTLEAPQGHSASAQNQQQTHQQQEEQTRG